MLIIQNPSLVYSSGALSSREAPPTNGLELNSITLLASSECYETLLLLMFSNLMWNCS